MNYQHTELASGRWQSMPFVEQMANIGSEVERAMKWAAKNDTVHHEQAVERALELVDLTLESALRPCAFREVARMREALVDYFFGTNTFASTESSWRNYFLSFACAARNAA